MLPVSEQVIDATFVRCLMVPALVALFGRYNWWLPRRLAGILRVAPSPLPKRASISAAEGEPVVVA